MTPYFHNDSPGMLLGSEWDRHYGSPLLYDTLNNRHVARSKRWHCIARIRAFDHLLLTPV